MKAILYLTFLLLVSTCIFAQESSSEECTEDSDCGSGQCCYSSEGTKLSSLICREGSCIPIQETCFERGTQCDFESSKCTCETSADCPSSSFSRCDSETGQCENCQNDDDCGRFNTEGSTFRCADGRCLVPVKFWANRITGLASSRYTLVDTGMLFSNPVFACTPMYVKPTTAMVVRIAGATTTGASTTFNIRAVAPGNVRPTYPVDVECIIMEGGVYTDGINGINVEAMVVKINQVSYRNTTTNVANFDQTTQPLTTQNVHYFPVVVGSLQNSVDTRFSTFFATGASRFDVPDGANIRVGLNIGEDKDINRLAGQKAGVIVFSGGTYSVGESFQYNIHAFRNQGFVQGVDNNPPYAVATELEGANYAVATLNSAIGSDGGFVVRYSTSDADLVGGNVDLAIDEDFIFDAERLHLAEAVGIVVVAVNDA